MSRRQRLGMSDEAVIACTLVGVAGVGALALWAGTELAALVGVGPPVPHNPLAAVTDLIRGRLVWSTGDTYCVAAMVGVLLLLVAAVLVRRRARAPRCYLDQQAQLLLRDRRALRRYVDHRHGPFAHLPPGPLIGTDAVGGAEVRATWEDVSVYLAGNRMRKTTTFVIPHILAAPGPVYATSNKRDVVDMTRGPRERVGRTWLYDPQAIAGGEPTWWWDPLEMAQDVAGAMTLAGVFATATKANDASSDSYFDPEGEALLALMLLAASRAGRPITDVYHWLSDAREDEPAHELQAASEALAAAGVRGILEQPDRQRAGVYGTARKMVGWLVDERLVRWCVDDETGRPRFRSTEFATSTDTVYSLSREGPGSAGPLTAAFTVGVMRAAEAVAASSPGGRLAVPLLPVLDEVANVCRWRDLPSLYSHYGSRGITIECYFQSWSQGVKCWGRDGMAQLWSAANVRVYGGGANEDQFLESISKICGEVDVVTESASDGRLGHTRSQSMTLRRILDVRTLGAVPLGRAVVMLSGAPPIVVRTRSCLEGPLARIVRGSMAEHGVAPATVTQAAPGGQAA